MSDIKPPFKERIRRVLTSVNPDGKSYVMADGEPNDVLILAGCRMVRLWQTDKVPADIPAKTDVTAPGLPRLPGQFEGTRFYTAELPSGVKTPLHKSLSVDYIAVLKGTLTLGLETGDVALSPGDVVVQTGNMHAWENRGAGPCLIMVCVVGAVES
ncbi:MAG: cupin domain-containing protein [Alphaproteobacteria bacterium]|nr:cupin domain-containing protein [Alphaproteobacteria bacterium]